MALYQGWDLDEMREERTGDDAALLSIVSVPTSSFTAINRPTPAQLLTPQPSTTSASLVKANRAKRRCNPAVADYLGLGAAAEPSHLEKYAPALPPTPPPRSKRRRKQQHGSSPAKVDKGKLTKPKQRRVSEGLHVTKPASTKRASPENAAPPFLAPNSQDGLTPQPDVSDVALHKLAAPDFQPSPSNIKLAHKGAKALPGKPDLDEKHLTKHHARDVPSRTADSSSHRAFTSGIALPELSSQDTIADDSMDDIFNSIDFDQLTNHSTTNTPTHSSLCLPNHQSIQSDGLGDDNAYRTHFPAHDLPTSTPVPTAQPKSPNQIAPARRAANAHLSTSATSTHTSEELQQSSLRDLSTKFISPVTLRTQLLIQKAEASSSSNRKPIVRSPFAAPVRNHSPIIGLSSNLLLRTCFRIGEVISQACRAAKHGQSAVFELYARVLTSKRDEVKQQFVFYDLFHSKPPYIKAVYDATIWSNVDMFDYDSHRLLREGAKCRSIGTMKREGKEWVMVVRNIWEATWEDIDWVEGIVDS